MFHQAVTNDLATGEVGLAAVTLTIDIHHGAADGVVLEVLLGLGLGVATVANPSEITHVADPRTDIINLVVASEVHMSQADRVGVIGNARMKSQPNLST